MSCVVGGGEVVRDKRGVLFALMEARRPSIKENARIIVVLGKMQLRGLCTISFSLVWRLS
jgi:hypothetical protein